MGQVTHIHTNVPADASLLEASALETLPVHYKKMMTIMKSTYCFTLLQWSERGRRWIRIRGHQHIHSNVSLVTKAGAQANYGWRIILWLVGYEVNEKGEKQGGLTLSQLPEYTNDRVRYIRHITVIAISEQIGTSYEYH